MWSIANQIGVDGVLWSIFFLITIIMLGLYRPSLAIIFSVFGVVALWAMKIIAIGWIAVTSLIAIAILLLIGMKKQ